MDEEKQYLEEIEEFGDFTVQPISNHIDFEHNDHFVKLDLKSHGSALTQHLIPAAATGMLANAYCVKFPEGVPHTLMKFKEGGYGSAIMGKKGIIDQASFHKMLPQATFMGVFTVMSAVTGQYFLSEINSKLEKINQTVTDILAFLYGDKKAELISEISFIQYAQKCFTSIMQHEEQRIATIIGIQSAKKVAMKDIDFYLNDLEATVQNKENTKEKSARSLSKNAATKQIISSLELSLQLYIMCSILEPYYSQNYDREYLDYIIEDTAEYVSKYRGCVRLCLGKMHGRISEQHTGKHLTYDLRARQAEIEKYLDSLPSGEKEIRQQMQEALYAPLKPTELYLTANGEAYYRLEKR